MTALHVLDRRQACCNRAEADTPKQNTVTQCRPCTPTWQLQAGLWVALPGSLPVQAIAICASKVAGLHAIPLDAAKAVRSGHKGSLLGG